MACVRPLRTSQELSASAQRQRSRRKELGRRSNTPRRIPRTHRERTAAELCRIRISSGTQSATAGPLQLRTPRAGERSRQVSVEALDAAGVAVSAGSACSAHHSGEPSGVLLAMGFDDERARGLIRVSLGRFNTHEEVDRFTSVLRTVVRTLPVQSIADLKLPGRTTPLVGALA